MDFEERTDGRTGVLPGKDSDDEENDVLDPRIQIELDQLNLSSGEINRMENELDEARSKYRCIVSETSGRMEMIAHNRKKSIQKAREYYRLVGEAKLAQGEALKAARQFQSSNGVYKAAKETVALAETRLAEETQSSAAAQLTSAWQEMLNHAISKVMEAEKEKTNSEQQHKRRSSKYAELEARIQVLEKKFTRSIKKARPYFELKSEMDLKLMQQKQNVNDLMAAIKSNKLQYTESLRKLETISEEIHQSRRSKIWSKIPRLPGVGAETESVSSNMSEMCMELSDISRSGSMSQDMDADSENTESELDECGLHFKYNQEEPSVTDVVNTENEQSENTFYDKGSTRVNIKSDDEVFHGNFQEATTSDTELETKSDILVKHDEESIESTENITNTSDSLTNLNVKCNAENRVTKDGACIERQPNDVGHSGVGRNDGNAVAGAEAEIPDIKNGTGADTIIPSSNHSERNVHISTKSTDASLDTVKDDYKNVDMKTVERPSLSGEED